MLLMTLLNNLFSPLTQRQINNLHAFSQYVSYAEGTKDRKGFDSEGWDIAQGYKRLNVNAAHPYTSNSGKCENRSNATIGGGPAVGKFQIEGSTWCDRGYRGKAITPENQTKVFIDLMKSARRIYNKGRGYGIPQPTTAYEDVLDGKFASAIGKLRGRYSSFPGGRRPSAELDTMAKALDYIRQQGGE